MWQRPGHLAAERPLVMKLDGDDNGDDNGDDRDGGDREEEAVAVVAVARVPATSCEASSTRTLPSRTKAEGRRAATAD